MIVIVDDLISEQDAAYCAGRTETAEPSEIFLDRRVYSIGDLFSNDLAVIKIIKTMEAVANQFCPNIEIDWAQFVVWPNGTRHDLHHDLGVNRTVFTSITYLNCAYRGGETFFDDGTLVAPITGRTVFFDGKKYLHGVRTISHGLRVSLPIWYRLKT